MMADTSGETGFWINGRYSMVSVNPDELWTASGRIDLVADGLLRCLQGIQGRWEAILDLNLDLSPGPAGGARVSQCGMAVNQATALLDGVVSALRSLSASLRGTATSYQEAERGAESTVAGAGDLIQSGLWLVPGLLAYVLGMIDPRARDEYVRALSATGAKDSVDALTHALSSWDGGVEEARLRQDAVTVTAERWHSVPPAPTPGTFLGSAFRSANRAAGDGPVTPGEKPIPLSSVVVDKYPRTDGSYAVIVSIPGTEKWAPFDSPDTTDDLKGDISAMAQGTERRSYLTQTQAAVVKALEAEHVTRKDDIVLNGYSQGGINAVALAANKDFTATYTVRAVNTAGSPVGRFLGRVDASVLALENQRDMVPALDGVHNPRRPNVVTARFSAETATVDPVLSGMAKGRPVEMVTGTFDVPTKIRNAHDIGNYIAAADRLETSHDPGVLRHQKVLADILGPDRLDTSPDSVRKATRTVYTAHEPPLGEDQCRR
ncbi:hypothetical protein QFZ52_002978 [Arthrobacter woluwensis]|uniref:WXG100 family type VII secretion target n=1 Tax=Arthrobacter woluwensis TaxID=156980 RepID=UPI0027807469|nr:hypothetical protein [Arthrobacter woluwensis]MDQ0710326.1 hypothetical protein [Arthrobacter woluwensis]